MTTDSTEKKILESARKVFLRKGMAGARMQEIADEAGINKALLHYYYRSKEKLFQSIFLESFQLILPKIQLILDGENPIHKKIEYFISDYIDLLIQNPYLPSFVINEINQNSGSFLEMIQKSSTKPDLSIFFKQIKSEIENGKIKPFNPANLIINILSLCIFPFLGKPMMITMLGMTEEDFNRLIENRKKEITEIITLSIKP